VRVVLCLGLDNSIVIVNQTEPVVDYSFFYTLCDFSTRGDDIPEAAEDDDLDDVNDGEGFPFNINDATDPVEV